MAKKKITYEEAIEEIETILSDIESEKLSIDEIAKNVKRVAELINFCKEKLKTTEDEVLKIINEIESE